MTMHPSQNNIWGVPSNKNPPICSMSNQNAYYM